MDKQRNALNKKITILRFNLFSFLLLSVIVVLIYMPGLHGPFLLDDLQTITPTSMPTFSWQKLLEISLQNQTGPLGRPITVATFALNQWLLGDSPYHFKVVNLFIHLITGLLAGTFIYLLLSFIPRKRTIAKQAAWLTMILWLVHPLQVSTVLYTVQRMTELSALFTLLGLNYYLIGRQRQWLHQSNALWFIGIAFFICFPLAVFSKETGLLFPWYILCIEYFILRFHGQTPQQSNHLRYFNLTLSTLLLIGAIGYFYLKLDYFLAIYAEKNLSLTSRLLTESKAIIFYISLIFRPSLAKMGLYHDDFNPSSTFDLITITSIALIASIVVAIYYYRKRAPVISFGFAWFLVSHSIESTVLPLELIFEHRNYIGMIGLLLIPSYYITLLIMKSRRLIKTLLTTFIILLTTILCILTYFRSFAWSNTERFLNEVNRYHPRSARAHIEMGNWYLMQKQYALAYKELDMAQGLQPDNVGILLHKILIGCQTHFVSPILYQIAIRSIRKNAINPYSIMVLDQMIHNMIKQECTTLDPKKIELIIQSALQNPTLNYKPLYKAVLYHLQAGIAFMQDDFIRCTALLMASFEAYPSRLDPLIQKALIEWHHGMTKEAKKTLAFIHEHAHFVKAPHDKIQQLDNLFQTR